MSPTLVIAFIAHLKANEFIPTWESERGNKGRLDSTPGKSVSQRWSDQRSYRDLSTTRVRKVPFEQQTILPNENKYPEATFPPPPPPPTPTFRHVIALIAYLKANEFIPTWESERGNKDRLDSTPGKSVSCSNSQSSLLF
ncbi:hypothetical protein CDAR_370601 [Caerostris darwini]|uniref:Uncharacterized protein n=1 Tax=Caerostris darwini TaxID=1538125 RepID=A0AAV4VI99_9ARAC|nr:hypothetical protein CDAR_370601 [Caerostris darwini]